MYQLTEAGRGAEALSNTKTEQVREREKKAGPERTAPRDSHCNAGKNEVQVGLTFSYTMYYAHCNI